MINEIKENEEKCVHCKWHTFLFFFLFFTSRELYVQYPKDMASYIDRFRSVPKRTNASFLSFLLIRLFSIVLLTICL